MGLPTSEGLQELLCSRRGGERREGGGSGGAGSRLRLYIFPVYKQHGRLSGSEGWRDSLWNSDQPCHCLGVSHQCLESEPPLAIFVVGETLLESTHNTCECTDEVMNPSLGFCSTRVLGSRCRNFFLFRLRQVLLNFEIFIGTIDSLFLIYFPFLSNRTINIDTPLLPQTNRKFSSRWPASTKSSPLPPGVANVYFEQNFFHGSVNIQFEII